MSAYYRRRSYSTNRSSRPFAPIKQDGKPIRKVNIQKYLTNEFFTCDEFTFRKIADLYCDLYGVNAHNYMMKTFYSWKSGAVGMSGQTFVRILQCVPRFLTDEKRFYILKCEVIFFLETIHYEQQKKNKKSTIGQINEYFKNYEGAINKFDLSNLQWFLGKGVFKENELKEFLSACKYSLQKKLSLAYSQVKNDLNRLRDKLEQYDIAKITGAYTIDFLSTVIQIGNIKNEPLLPITFQKENVNLDGAFKVFTEKYILEELVTLDFSEKDGEATGMINAHDLDLVFTHYSQLIKGKQDVVISSNFKGEGGVLSLSLEFEPFQKIIQRIIISSIKIIVVICIFTVALYFVFQKKQWWVLWIGIYIGFFLISKTIDEIKIIKKSINNLNK